MNMLEQLQRFETDKYALTDLIALEAFGRMVRQGFETRGIEGPPWLDDSLRAVSAEIAVKARGEIELRLREAKARLAANLSRDERRAAAQSEIERLEKQLQGHGPASVPPVTPQP